MWYVTYNIETRKIERIDNQDMYIDNPNLKTIMVEDENINDDVFERLYIYKVDENEQFYIDDSLIEEYELNILREKRAPLLKAFDIYKSNLLIGALVVSEEEQQEVITWYNLILDLDEDAINNPPEIIIRYVQN